MATTNFSSGTVIASSWLNDVDAVTYERTSDWVHAKEYGVVGDGTTDDTTALQNALTAASGKTLLLGGNTYAITSALTPPANVTIQGVSGLTTIKLLSSGSDVNLINLSGASTVFRVKDVIFDGNKATVSAVNTSGIYLSSANTVEVLNCTFKNFNDLGSNAGGKGVYMAHASSAEKLVVDNCTFTDIEGNAVQTYYVKRNIITNNKASGIITTFADINGQTLPTTDDVLTTIANNVIVCDASFPEAISVLSLLGNDIEAVGNKINGGGVQIVVHTGTTEDLVNYRVSGNMLWEAKANGITVNQTSGTNATNFNVVVSDNMIYQPLKDGIALVGTYVGSGATGGPVTVVGNTIIDNLTSTPSPEAYACIRLLGMTNTTVANNNITGPRWAGILCHYDGKNINISGNNVSDHQGRTDTAPNSGGPIVVSSGNATAALSGISITDNLISNFATTIANTSSIRVAGIVIAEAKTTNISVKNNQIITGNAVGISVYNADYVQAESNDVRGAYSVPLLTLTPGANCQLTYAITYPRHGTTGARPTLTAEQIGFNYWDTTIPEPVWWNGTVWKNEANGTV